MKLKSDVGLTSLTETMDVPTLGTKKMRDFQWIWWTVYVKTLGALFISKQMGFSGCPIIQFWEKF